MFLGAMPPPIAPIGAPQAINIGKAAAQAIVAAVSIAPVVADASEAMKSALHFDEATKAIQMVGQAKSVVEGGPAAWVNAAGGQKVLGAVLTNPITGAVTGKDIAGLIGAGNEAGIFHLGKVGGAAASAAAGSALPGGVQQYMALRTQAAAPEVNGDAVNNAIAQNLALGYSPMDARSVALEQHGVVLYQGDGAGVFNKVVPAAPVV